MSCSRWYIRRGSYVLPSAMGSLVGLVTPLLKSVNCYCMQLRRCLKLYETQDNFIGVENNMSGHV